VNDFFTSLNTLEVKDLGIVRKFLGMRVRFQDDGFTLDQETLVFENLENHSMANANTVSTSTVLHHAIEDDELLDAAQPNLFCTLADGLLWLER
jgi:hypothetical protein